MAKKKISTAVQSAAKRVIKDPKVYAAASPEQKKSMKEKIKAMVWGALGGLGVGVGYAYGTHRGYEQYGIDMKREINSAINDLLGG
jgi:hypothetical protein